MSNIKRDKLGRFKKGYYTGGSTGKHWKLSEKARKNQSKAQTGKKHPWTNPPHPKGKDHYNWKGGITSINQLIRQSKKYKKWQQTIYKRDNWTCQICKNHCHNKIIAHHIAPFSLFPKKRFQINNGITLCRKCHINLHKVIKKLIRLAKSSCQ